MFQSKVAAGIAGDLMAALKRQKYIDIISRSADDAPGMVEITATWDPKAKGSGRMPVITKKKWDGAKKALGDDQSRAAALELAEYGKNAGLRLIARLEEMRDAAAETRAGEIPPGLPVDDIGPYCPRCDSYHGAVCPEPAGDGFMDPAAPPSIPRGWCGRCNGHHEAKDCPVEVVPVDTGLNISAGPAPGRVQVPSMSYNPIDGAQPLRTRAAELTLEKYSEKAWVIRGNTKDHRAEIKAAVPGAWCAFNPRLKGGPGWILGAENADQFRAALAGLL